jgi:hypothetical protein
MESFFGRVSRQRSPWAGARPVGRGPGVEDAVAKERLAPAPASLSPGR